MSNPDFNIQLFRSGNLQSNHRFGAGEIVTIGRANQDVAIALDDAQVSRSHARMMIVNGRLALSDNSTNGTFVNKVKIEKGLTFLSHGDVITFGASERYYMVVDSISGKMEPDIKASIPPTEVFTLSELLENHDDVTIGREGVLKIEDTQKYTSRYHATVRKQGGKLTIEDQSLNGTYVNGRRIPKGVRVEFSSDDTIFIGLNAIKLDDSVRDLSREPAILGLDLSKAYKGKNSHAVKALSNMDIDIERQKFIALMGPSGCGKSTLLKILNNSISATTGKVYIHGLELSGNFDLLKRKIGYVPQDDIIHKELGVYKTLYYAAKLRMGDEVDDETIHRKIDEVLTNLNINRSDLKEKKVSELSGGQRKRVSIAVELLNDPSILFLDEPTSPLDPETIKDFLNCIRELTRKGIGTTVVMVTHKPDDLRFVDEVIFLTTKGYCAYFGKQGAEMQHYFEVDSIIDIYAKLSNEDHSAGLVPEDWGERWQSLETKDHKVPQSRPMTVHKESYLKQLWWLSRRYLNIKLNDRLNLKLLIAQPVVIAGLISLIFSQLQLGVLFLMAISAVWFGVNNAAKEIVGELPIYKRERMFNLNLSSYLFSKVIVLSLIAMVQVALFVLILWLRFSVDPINIVYVPQYLLFMTFLAISATLLGLLLSALSRNVEQVMTVVPIILIPQIMLAGVVTKIDSVFKEVLSYATLGRWGTESLARIQDSHSMFEVKREILEFDPGNLPPDTVSTDQFITYQESIYNPMPVPLEANTSWHQNTDGALEPYRFKVDIENVDGALQMLDFYPQESSLLKITEFSGIWGGIIAIGVLNLVCIIALYFMMRAKDRN